MRRLAVIVVVASALHASHARRADACSPPPCFAGHFVPKTGTTVPANTPALYWQPIQSGGSPIANASLVSLVATNAPATKLAFTATPIGMTGSYLLIPDQMLAAGTSYMLDDGNMCSFNQQNTQPMSTFTVAAAAAMPTELGSLTLSAGNVAPMDVFTSSGSCFTEITASSAIVTLELSASALPWRDALFFETLVDGQVWSLGNPLSPTPPGENGKGRGIELLWRRCHTDDPLAANGVSEGMHTVAMRVTLPGSTLSLTTAPVTFELTCPPDAVTPDNTDVVDDGPRSGCGCRSSDAPSSIWLAALLLVRRRSARRRRA